MLHEKGDPLSRCQSYFTDVLVGALIGTSCGFLVPFMHTQNYYAVFQKKKVQSSVSPLGFNVKFNF